MSERLRRRFDLIGPFRRWSLEELATIGTMPYREVARCIGSSLSTVRAKKFGPRSRLT
jgi:hypothetical protein